MPSRQVQWRADPMQLLINMWEVTTAEISYTKRQLRRCFWLCLGRMIHSQMKARSNGDTTLHYFFSVVQILL